MVVALCIFTGIMAFCALVGCLIVLISIDRRLKSIEFCASETLYLENAKWQQR